MGPGKSLHLVLCMTFQQKVCGSEEEGALKGWHGWEAQTLRGRSSLDLEIPARAFEGPVVPFGVVVQDAHTRVQVNGLESTQPGG